MTEIVYVRRAGALILHRLEVEDVVFKGLSDGMPGAPDVNMRTISNRKRFVSVAVLLIGLAAAGVAASWMLTPGPAVVPAESAESVGPAAPAEDLPFVAPPREFALPSHDETARPSTRVHSSPNTLQESQYEPI